MSPPQSRDNSSIWRHSSGWTASARPTAKGFEVLVLGAADRAVLRIDDSPIRETKMVLSDSVLERHFQRTEDLEISIIDPIAVRLGPGKGAAPSGS